MLCAVLGGTGFVGSHLVDSLRDAGHGVRVLDLAPNSYRGETNGCEYLYGDWQDDGLLGRTLEGVECVYHLIGTVDVDQANANPDDDVRQTVLGSINLLHGCVARQVRRVVFVSSGGAVYGVPRMIPIREDHPTDPISAHGISKLTVEKYLQLFGRLHGLEYQIARCANPYGEGQNPFRNQGAVAVFLSKMLAGEPITIWGDGSVVRDYVYVGDVAEALRRLGEYTGPSGIFNVGGGVGLSLKDLLQAMARVAGHPPEIEYRPGRPYDVPRNVLDISAIMARAGWRPRTNLAAGLERTLAWMRSVRGTIVSLR